MSQTKPGAPATHKTLLIIELMSNSDQPLGLSEISSRLGLNKNTTQRILVALRTEGWITAVTPCPKYRLTLLPFHITSRPVSRLGIRELAHEPMRQLWEETGETVFLSIPYQDGVLHILDFDSRREVRIGGMAGSQYPFWAGSSSKVLLAYAGESTFERAAKAGFRRYRQSGVHKVADIRASVEDIRRQGWAVEIEEVYPGAAGFSAPVFNHGREAIGAIGMTVLTAYVPVRQLVEELGPKIIHVCREVSHKLGADLNTISNEKPILRRKRKRK